jgi:serine/threonine-protein kinase
MKEIAFGEGESITYLRGERDWIAVSGLKGDRIFYRKAVIACQGRSWHLIAFEYPATMKQTMDAFVGAAAIAVQNSEEDGCDKELWSSTSQQIEKPR